MLLAERSWAKRRGLGGADGTQNSARGSFKLPLGYLQLLLLLSPFDLEIIHPAQVICWNFHHRNRQLLELVREHAVIKVLVRDVGVEQVSAFILVIFA